MKRWWVKLSTDAADHPKMLGLDLPAFGLWAKSLCYAGRQEMEGFVPRRWVDRETKDDAGWRLIPGQLVDARLWDPTDDGWMIHNWDQRQVHDADERKRELARQRQARHRERRREADPGSSSKAVADSNVTSRTEERREEKKREDKTRTSTSEDMSCADVTPDVRKVWDIHRDATNRTGKYILNKRRGALIEARIEQYSLQDILDAVRGWEYIPFYAGDNDRGQKYNSIEVILKDCKTVEDMRDAYREAQRQRRSVYSEAEDPQDYPKPIRLADTPTISERHPSPPPSTPPRTSDDLGASRDPSWLDLPEDDWRPREPDGSG